MTQPPKNYSGTKNKILFFVSGIAAGIALTTGLYVNAQVISLTAKQINPLFQTTSSIPYASSILYGKLESMQRAINGLYDVCAK